MRNEIIKKQELVELLEKKNIECASRGVFQSGLDAVEFVSISKQLSKAKKELKNLTHNILTRN